MTGRIKSKHQHVASLEAEMLRCVRRAGRPLARATGARAQARALDGGHLRGPPGARGVPAGKRSRRRETAGRPPTSLVPNPDGGRFIGVDFEARNLMATVVDFSAAAAAAGAQDAPARRLGGADSRQDRAGD